MINKYPLVSVIILNFNGGKIFDRCLDSVWKSDYPHFEIILVDNGSQKKETNRLQKKYNQRAKIILNKKNVGFAMGNNIGVRHAKGIYLVFLNNDTVVTPNWISKAAMRLENDHTIAFLQPKIKSLKYKKYFEYAGGAGGYIDFFGYPFVRGRIFGTIEEDIGQYDDERDVFWASGVCLFCRKKIFLQLGGFDPKFFAYAEEDDLCFRAWRSGYKSIYYPEAEIYHLGGYTSNQNIAQKIFLIHRNHLLLLLKNIKIRQLIVILPCRMFMDIGTFFYYLLKYRSRDTAFSIIRAYLSLLFNLKNIIAARLKDTIGNFGYPTRQNLVYRGSIVFDYFFLGKTKWGKIMENKDCPSKQIKLF